MIFRAKKKAAEQKPSARFRIRPDQSLEELIVELAPDKPEVFVDRRRASIDQDDQLGDGDLDVDFAFIGQERDHCAAPSLSISTVGQIGAWDGCCCCGNGITLEAVTA